MGHAAGALGQQHPRQQAAEHCVAHADPDAAHPDVPAMHARVTDKDTAEKIRGVA
jgi:hypothetical protein